MKDYHVGMATAYILSIFALWLFPKFKWNPMNFLFGGLGYAIFALITRN